ncbi:hypothetical protein ANN_01943, partial [Periplaneta americana]
GSHIVTTWIHLVWCSLAIPPHKVHFVIRNIKSRHLRWTGHVARTSECRNTYRMLVGRPEGKRPLGKPRRRRKDDIKMDLREVGCDGRDWINLAQNRGPMAGLCEGGNEPLGSLKTFPTHFELADQRSSKTSHLPRMITPFLDHSPQLKSGGTDAISSASVQSFQFSDSCVVFVGGREYAGWQSGYQQPAMPLSAVRGSLGRVADTDPDLETRDGRTRLPYKRAKKAQPLVFAVERAEAGGGNRDAT